MPRERVGGPELRGRPDTLRNTGQRRPPPRGRERSCCPSGKRAAESRTTQRTRRLTSSAFGDQNGALRRPPPHSLLRRSLPKHEPRFRVRVSVQRRCTSTGCQGQAEGSWCVPDMPAQNGAPIYNKADAERAWGKLMALYRGTIA